MPDGLSEDDVALNDAFRSALLADLAPRGALQEVVAERILIGLWRSLRGAGGERVRPRRLIVRWTEGEGGPEWHRVELDLDPEVLEAMGPAELARYDAAIARMLRRDLEQLGAMQGRVIGAPDAARSSRSSTKRRP
jgi:hypothetical protein